VLPFCAITPTAQAAPLAENNSAINTRSKAVTTKSVTSLFLLPLFLAITVITNDAAAYEHAIAFDTTKNLFQILILIINIFSDRSGNKKPVTISKL